MHDDRTELRILVLDDEVIIARDLENILKRNGYRAVEVVTSSTALLERCPSFLPHLVLLDVNLEEDQSDGIDLAAGLLTGLDTQIIFISAHSNASVLERAGQVQPLSYLLKPYDENQVLTTLKVAENNPRVWQGGRSKLNLRSLLTATEYRVLCLIADHRNTADIARHLNISPKTVDNHRYNIGKKLALDGCNNALLVWALKHRSALRAG